MIVILTRHGLTTRSHPEQHLGQRIDVSLSEGGRVQAEAIGRRLASVALSKIVSSPLLRARETADIVAARGRAGGPDPVLVDPRLAEMDYGVWEGLTYDQIDAQFGPQRRQWEGDPAAMPCPGGESGNDVAARVTSLLAELLAGPVDPRPVLLVGHSTTNRVLVSIALGIPVRDYRRRIVQGQANLTVLEWAPGTAPDRARAKLVNDLSHVRPPSQPPWE